MQATPGPTKEAKEMTKDKSQTGLYVGDRIQIYGDRDDLYTCDVEMFRDCLGVFLSPSAREAGQFTPLCDLYGHGSGSSNGYISNHGGYIKDPVALWSQVTKSTPIGGW